MGRIVEGNQRLAGVLGHLAPRQAGPVPIACEAAGCKGFDSFLIKDEQAQS